MHVGLNLLYLVPGAVGGSETYARELVAALVAERPADRFTIFCGREAAPVVRAWGHEGRVTVAELPVRAAIKPLRIAAELALLPLAAARHRVEVLHSLGTTSPPSTRSARVVTVLDLIYDHFPDSFAAPARAGLKLLVPLGARRAHRVIAISAAGRDDLVERLGVAPGDVDVVHLGLGARPQVQPAAEAVVRERWALGPGPVILSVSAALPHKNLDRLLRAFALVAAERPDVRLVLVGHAGRLQDDLVALAERSGLRDRVRFTGWIEQEELEGLYALAAAFVYPSLMEGFGLPLLEAMRRGVPVACSDVSAMPEIAGDAALLFDPHDDAAVATALRRLLDDAPLVAELRRRGHARTERFSWQRTAAETWRSYERAVGAT
jgi:glycosyltransferase involved in cell wall biosynthesis